VQARAKLLGPIMMPHRRSFMPASWSPVRLGRAGLEVVPLGVASAYGISGRDVERAFERGVDFFYWGSARMPEDRPGIVSYTATSWGQLLKPSLIPPGERAPTATDCYRFVLSNPNVNACWTGPKNTAQLDQALAALDQGPMAEEELAWMRRVGVAVRDQTNMQSRGIGFTDRIVNFISGFGFRATSDLERG